MTQPVSRAARLLAAAAAAALAVGALTGCSAHPGEAYAGTYTGVDGKPHAISVSEEDVQVAASELSAVPDMNAPTIMNLLVSGQFLEGVAEEYGITVTDDDAREIIDRAVKAASGQPADDYTYSRASIDVARSALIIQVLSSTDQDPRVQPAAEAAAAVQASLVGEASPRYTLGQQTWRVPTAASLTGAGPAGGPRSS